MRPEIPVIISGNFYHYPEFPQKTKLFLFFLRCCLSKFQYHLPSLWKFRHCRMESACYSSLTKCSDKWSQVLTLCQESCSPLCLRRIFSWESCLPPYWYLEEKQDVDQYDKRDISNNVHGASVSSPGVKLSGQICTSVVRSLWGEWSSVRAVIIRVICVYLQTELAFTQSCLEEDGLNNRSTGRREIRTNN